MYADDTNLTYASNNVHNIQISLNEDLEDAHNWQRVVVVDYSTDRPSTLLRLKINLISNSAPNFQLFGLEKFISSSCTVRDKLTCFEPMSVLKFLHVYHYMLNNRIRCFFYDHLCFFCYFMNRFLNKLLFHLRLSAFKPLSKQPTDKASKRRKSSLSRSSF